MKESVWIIEYRGIGSAPAERWYLDSGFVNRDQVTAQIQAKSYARLVPKFDYRAVEYVRKEGQP